MEPLLSLPPQQFRAALAELQLDPQREAALLRQYREANSPLAPVFGLLSRIAGQDADDGRQRASMLPVSRPEGMSVAEAVQSGQAQFAVPQGVIDAVSALARGVDAPAAAARGLIPAEDMIGEAMGTAGVAMGAGGLLGRLPDDAVGMFAGKKAITADLSALRRAERMAERGASRDDIWQETGWVQGADGNWRFEIDDSGSQMRPMASILAGQPIRLGNAFSHIALRNAYPDLFDPSNLTYRYDQGSIAGEFRPGRQGTPSTIQIRAPQQADMAEARSVTLHELQHAVQRAEGWDTGSNTALRGQVGNLIAFRPTGDQILDAIRSGDQLHMGRLRANLPGGFEAYERMNQFFPTATADEIIAAVRPAAREEAFGTYERTPGEIEGRLTQARDWMTAADRRAVPPWQSTVPYAVSDRSLENARNYLAQFGLLAQ